MFVEPFRYFDPLTGEPPRWFRLDFSRIANRARFIVDSWEQKDIERAADAYDWHIQLAAPAEWITKGTPPAELEIYHHYEEAVRIYEELFMEHLVEERPEVRHDDDWCERLERVEDPDSRLFKLVAELGEPAVDGIFNVTWPKLYSAGALALIGDLASHLHRLQSEKPDRDGEFYLEIAAKVLARCVRAITYADVLLTTESQIKERVLDEQRREGLRNAEKRHFDGNQLKRKFFRFYDEGTFASKADAIKKFKRTLGEDELKLFRRLDRVLMDALRDREKSLSP